MHSMGRNRIHLSSVAFTAVALLFLVFPFTECNRVADKAFGAEAETL